MTHFGILCLDMTGHLNPMCALGRELQRRGHRVTLFGIPDIQPKVINSGLDFWKFGEAEFPTGSLEQKYKQLGEMSGLTGAKFTVRWVLQETAMLFREAPEALKAAGVEALLIDQVIPGGSIADKLNLPFITVCNALLINREPGIPPYFTDWKYNPEWWARLRNQMGYFFFLKLVMQPIWDLMSQQRKKWNLPPYARWEDGGSQLAQICQIPAEFDYPRVNLPDCFHYTGPLQEPSGIEPVSFSSISFPFEKLTDQPLIYASLGTLQNRLLGIFQQIAEACVGSDRQLVISLGNPNSLESCSNLPGNPIVVPYAPQLQLLERASLVITHAGINTVLGALTRGVPMVAIPITNDQPATANRLVRIGAGEVIPLAQLSVPRLRATIERVLTEDSYKKNASTLKEAIAKAGGVIRAADIVEQAITTGKPVLP